MSDAELYEQLTEVFHDVFLRDDIALTPATTAKDVDGWDSFKMIEIVMAVEKRFGVRVQSKQLDSLETVGELVDIIRVGRSNAA
ncbi:MAG: acyl carrier protein [Methylocystaceae bacterium]|nr:MAG: acyl carrier protein [Methylocystaceae bacterium]